MLKHLVLTILYQRFDLVGSGLWPAIQHKGWFGCSFLSVALYRLQHNFCDIFNCYEV